MAKWLIHVTLLGLIVLAACTTGGYNFPPGSQCVDGFNPFNVDSGGNMQLPPQQKPIFDKNTALAAKALPVGKYNYGSSTFWYIQRPIENAAPLSIDINEGLNSTT